MTAPFIEKDFLGGLPLSELARIKRLPDYLCIVDIVRLYFPDPETQLERDDCVKADTLSRNRLVLTKTLINACSKGLLKYKPGSPPNTVFTGCLPRSHPNAPALQESFKMFLGSNRPPCNEWAIIHKDDYKTYLQNSEQWPVDGLAANWWHDDDQKTKAVGDDAKPKRKERELTKWLRETWIKEGKPDGTDFFNALKKYVNKEGSPIVEHYTAGKNGAGFRWNTGNATNTMTKKRIQTLTGIFKKEP
ncbi:MAG: hypothetical protein WAW61_15610 [Methylococcaceae bacterium]